MLCWQLMAVSSRVLLQWNQNQQSLSRSLCHVISHRIIHCAVSLLSLPPSISPSYNPPCRTPLFSALFSSHNFAPSYPHPYSFNSTLHTEYTSSPPLIPLSTPIRSLELTLLPSPSSLSSSLPSPTAHNRQQSRHECVQHQQGRVR